MFCEKCGQQISKKMKFCPNCGNKIIDRKEKKDKIVLSILWIGFGICVVFLICISIAYLINSDYWEEWQIKKRAQKIVKEHGTEEVVVETSIESEIAEGDSGVNTGVLTDDELAEITSEIDNNWFVVSVHSGYPDGSEYVYDYEYDDQGRVIKTGVQLTDLNKMSSGYYSYEYVDDMIIREKYIQGNSEEVDYNNSFQLFSYDDEGRVEWVEDWYEFNEGDWEYILSEEYYESIKNLQGEKKAQEIRTQALEEYEKEKAAGGILGTIHTYYYFDQEIVEEKNFGYNQVQKQDYISDYTYEVEYDEYGNIVRKGNHLTYRNYYDKYGNMVARVEMYMTRKDISKSTSLIEMQMQVYTGEVTQIDIYTYASGDPAEYKKGGEEYQISTYDIDFETLVQDNCPEQEWG